MRPKPTVDNSAVLVVPNFKIRIKDQASHPRLDLLWESFISTHNGKAVFVRPSLYYIYCNTKGISIEFSIKQFAPCLPDGSLHGTSHSERNVLRFWRVAVGTQC